MGLFARAYSSALKAADRTITEAAALAGITQSSVSRIASGDSLPDPANIAKLLLALEPGDRTHCLRQYLLEHTPEEYHGRMILTFGDVLESNAERLDNLSAALRFLEREATENKHVERVLTELAITLGGGALALTDELQTAEGVVAAEAARRRADEDRNPSSRNKSAIAPATGVPARMPKRSRGAH